MSTSQLPDYFELAEPALSFDPYDARQVHAHPLRGLERFGPFSKSILGAIPADIRLATIAPSGQSAVIAGIVADLAKTHQPRERRAYLPPFPGFQNIFKQRLVIPPTTAIELPPTLDATVGSGPDPQRALSEAISQAISQLRTMRADWDVLMIYLPDRWLPAFEGVDDDFDLHHFIKATAAAQAIPTQVLNDDVINYGCRASVGWRLGIALYAKAGGVPWKMLPIQPDTAFIGLSYAVSHDRGIVRFVTCCSQIFDADGTGLEFLAYETDMSKVTMFGRNPFLSREQMRGVMGRSLALYLDRHPGRPPRRVVVHKNTEFKWQEVEGCFDALGQIDEVELLKVQDTSWRGVRLLAPTDTTERSHADNYPLHRGTMMVIGEAEALLWTQGDASSVTGGTRWFPEGKGIPRPLLLQRYAGRGEAQMLGAEVLALSKMNWNNDALYDTLPGTLAFAHRLAEVVKRIPKLDPRPYPLRLFM